VMIESDLMGSVTLPIDGKQGWRSTSLQPGLIGIARRSFWR